MPGRRGPKGAGIDESKEKEKERSIVRRGGPEPPCRPYAVDVAELRGRVNAPPTLRGGTKSDGDPGPEGRILAKTGRRLRWTFLDLDTNYSRKRDRVGVEGGEAVSAKTRKDKGPWPQHKSAISGTTQLPIYSGLGKPL